MSVDEIEDREAKNVFAEEFKWFWFQNPARLSKEDLERYQKIALSLLTKLKGGSKNHIIRRTNRLLDLIDKKELSSIDEIKAYLTITKNLLVEACTEDEKRAYAQEESLLQGAFFNPGSQIADLKKRVSSDAAGEKE